MNFARRMLVFSTAVLLICNCSLIMAQTPLKEQQESPAVSIIIPALGVEDREKALTEFKSAFALTSEIRTLEEWHKKGLPACKKIVPKAGQFFHFPSDEPRFEHARREDTMSMVYTFFPDFDAGTYTLQELHFIWGSADEILLKNIKAWLLAQRPSGEELNPEEYPFYSHPRRYYQYLWKWQSNGQLTALYSFDRQDPSVGSSFELHFIWRNNLFYQWQRLSERNEISFGIFNPLVPAEDEAKGKFPILADRLTKACQESGLDPKGFLIGLEKRQDIIDRRTELDRLLELATAKRHIIKADDPTYPALTYLVDRLFSLKLELLDGSNGPYEEFFAKYSPMGYQFEYCALAHCYALCSDSLVELATHHLNSRWGRLAFLHMTRSQWTDCGTPLEVDDNSTVAPTIARAEKYLAENPTSDIALDLMLELAMAHEMWWCVGKATAVGQWEEAMIFTKGYEEARQKAIRYYKQILNKFNIITPLQRLWIQNVIILLEREEDTHQDRYLVYAD